MRASRVRSACVAFTSLWLLAAAPSFAQTQSGVTFACDRACLTRVVDAYLEGLVANDPARVPLAPGARITSTLRATKSAANCGCWSNLPSA